LRNRIYTLIVGEKRSVGLRHKPGLTDFAPLKEPVGTTSIYRGSDPFATALVCRQIRAEFLPFFEKYFRGLSVVIWFQDIDAFCSTFFAGRDPEQFPVQFRIGIGRKGSHALKLNHKSPNLLPLVRISLRHPDRTCQFWIDGRIKTTWHLHTKAYDILVLQNVFESLRPETLFRNFPSRIDEGVRDNCYAAIRVHRSRGIKPRYREYHIKVILASQASAECGRHILEWEL
jgi:hypothetical protein